MPQRLYSLHHQDALTTCAFHHKGHTSQQFLVISTTYSETLAQRNRQ